MSKYDDSPDNHHLADNNRYQMFTLQPIVFIDNNKGNIVSIMIEWLNRYHANCCQKSQTKPNTPKQISTINMLYYKKRTPNKNPFSLTPTNL